MNWNKIFEIEKNKEYYKNLQYTLDKEYSQKTIYPSKENIFNAFELTAFDDIKIVILGQDPYHQINQAQGLAFSTPKELANPPSMVNILKEIEDEFKKPSICVDGDLTPWAKQGVLLINTILTVEDSKPKSHHKIGWKVFTDNIIKTISVNRENIIFLLWGANAIKKEKLIDDKHHILKSPHPSPLSSYRGFFGCGHFKQSNKILESINKSPIKW